MSRVKKAEVKKKLPPFSADPVVYGGLHEGQAWENFCVTDDSDKATFFSHQATNNRTNCSPKGVSQGEAGMPISLL